MKKFIAMVLLTFVAAMSPALAAKGPNCEKCCKDKSCKECCGDDCSSCKKCN